MNSMKKLNRMSQCLLKSSQVNQSGKPAYGSQMSRDFSDEKKNMKLEETVELIKKNMSKVRHMDWVTSFGLPTVRNKLFPSFYLRFRMPSIDSKFNKEQFLDNCKEATIVFCNFIANKEVDKCEELMTPEAYRALTERYKDAPDQHFDRLRLNNENIDYHNLIFLNDFKEASRFGQRFIVEATLTILKKNDDEKLNKLYLFSDLIIVKFARDYTDGENSNTDWIISYYDHLFVDSNIPAK